MFIFCQEQKIQLCNRRASTELRNHHLILQELATAKLNPRLRCLHYTRASDIARIAILYQEGGIYSDTDSKPLQPFGEMDSKHGLLLKMHDDLKFEEIGYKGNILIDFITSIPGHELLNTATKISIKDYRIYEKSRFREWEKSENGADLAYGGGLLARFSMFYCRPNATSDEIIEALKERAGNNPDGASQKTLDDLSI